MIGISGSGWTTTLAAIDRSAHPRDHLRRGTLPGYLRRQDAPCSQPDRGDLEQYHPVLYAMVDYLDLYILGSYGPGRGQLQVLNQYDSCCFAGVHFRTY